MFSVARRSAGIGAARAAAALLSASPLLVVFGSQPMSDVPGAALAWTVLALALAGGGSSRTGFVAGFLFGLLGGVRVSTLPFAAPAVACMLRRTPRAVAAGLLLGGVSWAVALVAIVSPSELWTRAVRHAGGHFGSYGGSVLTTSSPVERATGIVRGAWAHGLGGAWSGGGLSAWIVTAALAAVAIIAALHARRGARRPDFRLVLTSALAQLVWVALAQNVTQQPRHLIPIVPALVLIVAHAGRALWGCPRAWPLRVLLAAGALAGADESLRLARVQASTPAPVVRMARELEARPDAASLVVASARYAGWLRWRAPAIAVERADSVEAALASTRAPGSRLLVTSDVPGSERLGAASLVAFAGSEPAITFVDAKVWLYQLR